MTTTQNPFEVPCLWTARLTRSMLFWRGYDKGHCVGQSVPVRRGDKVEIIHAGKRLLARKGQVRGWLYPEDSIPESTLAHDQELRESICGRDAIAAYPSLSDCRSQTATGKREMNMRTKHPLEVFRCTPEQLRAQYARNAAQLRQMRLQALKTGSKVNGFTGAELARMAHEMEGKVANQWSNL